MQEFSNSPLVVHTNLSPNCSKRTHNIDMITIHCMAGNASIEVCGKIFEPASRQASSNYGVGSDGRIALYVEEKNRSWCTSSTKNDDRAVTIEVANIKGAPNWEVSDAALQSLIDLCYDICKRNNIKELKFENDPKLFGDISRQNMSLHRWFAAKACPGNDLINKHTIIVEEVNNRLRSETDMTKEELVELINETVDKKLDTINKRYKNISDIPEYWADDIKDLIKQGVIKGEGNDEKIIDNKDLVLNLSRDSIKSIIVSKRYTDLNK